LPALSRPSTSNRTVLSFFFSPLSSDRSPMVC
jgi:hypothetical protein